MDFWEGESSLVSKIQGELIIVSENDIREALKLEDVKTDPKELN